MNENTMLSAGSNETGLVGGDQVQQQNTQPYEEQTPLKEDINFTEPKIEPETKTFEDQPG